MPQKHFGPFTGRQLTTIVCVLAVTIAFPVGAWATVAGSPVFIADNHTGAHAAVDATDNLQTKVNGGNLVAVAAAPTNQVNAIASTFGGGCAPLFSVPAGKAFVLTSLTMSVNTPATTSSTLVGIYASATCGATTISQIAFDPNSHGTFAEPFPSGLAITAGHELSAVVSGTGASPYVTFSINGHYVPLSQCTSVCH